MNETLAKELEKTGHLRNKIKPVKILAYEGSTAVYTEEINVAMLVFHFKKRKVKKKNSNCMYNVKILENYILILYRKYFYSTSADRINIWCVTASFPIFPLEQRFARVF